MKNHINTKAFEVLARLEQEEKDLASQDLRTNWIIEHATGDWLYHMIDDLRPALIVEAGTSVGYSTTWLGEATRLYGGRVVSIEKDPAKHLVAQRNLAEAELYDVELILGDAQEVLKAWSGSAIDLLFLDANKKGYLPQFLAAEPHLSAQAIVIADNVIDMQERVQDFIDHMNAHPGFETHIETVGDGLLVARRK